MFGKLINERLPGTRVALRTKIDKESDVEFKSGFTIRSDKSPNFRGANEILAAQGVALSSESELWESISSGSIKAVLFFGGDPQEKLSDQEKEAWTLDLDVLGPQ